MLQFIQRVPASAHGQKLQVPFHSGSPLGTDALGECRGGGVSCRIFVYIEGTVEVRDPCPFVLYFLIDDQFIAEIVPDQTEIQRIESGRIESFSLFRHAVGLHLEFGKHGLPVDCSLEVFQILCQQRHAFGGIGFLLKQLFDHEVLIDRGSDLSHEEGVIGVLWLLRPVGVPGVEGMPHLMSYGGNTVQRAGIVQQNIGIGIISPGGEGSAGFAAVGIDIDPAVTEGTAHHIAVFLTQRGNCVQHNLLGFFISVPPAAGFSQRCVQIVVMQFIKPHESFPQPFIPVHGGHVLPYGGDQVVIHFSWDVLTVHGHGPGGFIVAGCGLSSGPFHTSGIGSGKGVDVGAVSFIQAFKRVFPQCPVR